MALAITLHVLAAIVWVGGMFFAHVALRPTAAEQLEPPRRLPLWTGVFARFFPWVWLAVILLLATGYWLIFGVFGGMAAVGVYVHVMNGTGLLMSALFIALFFIPYPRLKKAVVGREWAEGARQLVFIRRIVGVNLVLGLITAITATVGKYL